LSPTQHPEQFDASHWLDPHWRVAGSQVRPCCAQSMQLAPPRPQAAGSAPARHVGVPVSKLQHPPTQVDESQLVTLRAHAFVRLSQNWKPFATQSEQRWPREPQARVSPPLRQVLPSQQPLGQFAGVQSEGVPPSVGVSSSRLERPQPGAKTMKKRAAKHATVTK
jgi:hypothetical protein